MNTPSHTAFLVIGSGIAGLRYALEVAKHGTVTVVTKKTSADSNTNYAQGGIAAVMSPEDDFTQHIQDTLICGAGICDKAIVEMVVKEGPERVNELLKMGASFTQENGALHLGREGGHSARRIVHATDATGKEIEKTLMRNLQQHPDITLLEYHYVTDLIVKDGQCIGATILSESDNSLQPLYAVTTLLASGGSGQVYRYTTNPSIATGDGLAMAWRAGAHIANMEFFQFHPTVLHHPDSNCFLISEAVRGAGATLRNQAGESFMEHYHPQKELAPRDVVARAIHDQLHKHNDAYVLLDISHKDAEKTRQSFPTIYSTCLKYGIDITKEAIPVVPAAHYQCGGVITDATGKTNLDGLFACGEVAYTGLHGANRLASNSLLEALVFSHHAAHAAVQFLNNQKITQPIVSHETFSNNTPDKNKANEDKIISLRQEVQNLMSSHAAIVRNNKEMEDAKQILTTMESHLDSEFRQTQLTVPLQELRNLITVAQLIITSALQRQESRGLHYLADHSEKSSLYEKPTLLLP